jgi:hypothetical protein
VRLYLGDALLDSAPAAVADDIEHRGKTLVNTELPHGLTDSLANLVHEFRVEGRAP